MGTLGNFRDRRQAELLAENGKLVALNARLGIRSTLQTTMPTTGVGAFIGVSTGHAIVRIDQLEFLADQITEARKLVDELNAELESARIDADNRHYMAGDYGSVEG